jgi:neutral amino acid transport system ATP-binding protein
MSPSEPLLEVRELRKRFGGIAALDGCSFSVSEGTITGLIGPNGSGKTTAFNVITGYLRADSGDVVFAGQRVARPKPERMYRRGLVRTFQRARVFGELTSLENLVAAGGQPRWSVLTPRVRRAEAERAREVLAEFGLSPVEDLPAGRLSYGQRKLLEFAALLMSRPRLVLLDEPTAGVNPVLVEAMERHIRAYHKAGISFLVVEHDMGLVARLCDPVIVLDRGARIAEGPIAAVQSDSAVLDAYLGD